MNSNGEDGRRNKALDEHPAELHLPQSTFFGNTTRSDRGTFKRKLSPTAEAASHQLGQQQQQPPQDGYTQHSQLQIAQQQQALPHTGWMPHHQLQTPQQQQQLYVQGQAQQQQLYVQGQAQQQQLYVQGQAQQQQLYEQGHTQHQRIGLQQGAGRGYVKTLQSPVSQQHQFQQTQHLQQFHPVQQWQKQQSIQAPSHHLHDYHQPQELQSPYGQQQQQRYSIQIDRRQHAPQWTGGPEATHTQPGSAGQETESRVKSTTEVALPDVMESGTASSTGVFSKIENFKVENILKNEEVDCVLSEMQESTGKTEILNECLQSSTEHCDLEVQKENAELSTGKSSNLTETVLDYFNDAADSNTSPSHFGQLVQSKQEVLQTEVDQIVNRQPYTLDTGKINSLQALKTQTEQNNPAHHQSAIQTLQSHDHHGASIRVKARFSINLNARLNYYRKSFNSAAQVPSTYSCSTIGVIDWLINRSHVRDIDNNLRQLVSSLVEKLSVVGGDLGSLVRAVETAGTCQSDCVTMELTDSNENFHLMFFEIWRPIGEFLNKDDLVHQDYCKHPIEQNQQFMCVNPYHYEMIEPINDLAGLSLQEVKAREGNAIPTGADSTSRIIIFLLRYRKKKKTRNLRREPSSTWLET